MATILLYARVTLTANFMFEEAVLATSKWMRT